MSKVNWKLVKHAPEDGREVLACFRHQFGWVVFVATAQPRSMGGVQQAGFAPPTYYADMPDPPERTSQ